MSTRIVEVRAKVMKQNDLLAHALRQRFQASGITVVGLVSSPGSGKTAFLEKLLAGLAQDFRVAALVGDLATENDAARLKRATPNVRQITTGTICHLDAQMIDRALEGWHTNPLNLLPDAPGIIPNPPNLLPDTPGILPDTPDFPLDAPALLLDNLDFLFIENVGNLVCPSSYDLGEQLRFVLLSATEGEDKPLKYPTIFNSSDVAIITKMDMAEAADFDVAAARRNIQSVRPGMKIFEVSAKTGLGMQEVFHLLHDQLAKQVS